MRQRQLPSHSPSFKKKFAFAVVTIATLIFIYQVFGPSPPPAHLIPIDLTPQNTCNEGPIQQLRWSPRAFLRHGIIPESDRQAILAHVRSKIDIRAPLPNRNLTASRAVEIDNDIDALKRLEQKLSEWVMLPLTHGEKFIARRFQPGDSFQPHFDFFEDLNDIGESGQRIITVVYFLESATVGGEFDFVRSQYVVAASSGDTLLYHNRLPNAQPDLMSLHTEHPTIEGEKWTLTKYYRELPYNPRNKQIAGF